MEKASALAVAKGPAPAFVELLARSCFSFLQGASQPEEMVRQAIELEYDGIALCDVNGLYGSVRGFQAAERTSAFDAESLAIALRREARTKEFRYLIGAELTLHDASPIALLPMNKDGYSRLSHLITAAKRPAPKGFISLGLKRLLQENEDLIALPLPPWNDKDLQKLKAAFQDRIYLPVHKDLTWSSVVLYSQALAIERDFKIPLFATGRPLYHVSERKPLHDVVTCILHGTTLEEASLKLSPNSERALKTLSELRSLWRERPDMLARTEEIAKRISFSLTELRYRYPREALPHGKNSTEFLAEQTELGLQNRYPNGVSAEVRKQIAHELELIQKLEYEDYFLTIWDICTFARQRGILCQGRGSAANSAVCFALGITSVDPISLNLLFERFISAERGEPPDIDVDFEHERREEVIQYIYAKYGARHAAMVCTTICYRSRMAVREVAKVFGASPEEIARLAKHMGREGLQRLLGDGPPKLATTLGAEKLRQIIRFAVELQGFPRHLGIHSGGFVIAQDPIVDVVPVEKASMDDRYVVQWNKDDIAALGLMKIDVLSLGMLTAIRKSFDLLKEHKGIDLGLADIPEGDKPTYEMACAADTVGVFQIESRAQMSLLPRLKPRTYYDLVVEVAIVRPGPIQGGMVHPYLRRREGLEKVFYAHPSLKPILEKTLGVPLFQEQIMQIAVAVAGFTAGEADELRRIMSSHWTKIDVMEGLRQRLIGGMLAHGIKPQFAEQIYKTIQGFSSYGFPESHAASFALLTYASVYLKCRHPDVFICALLNSQPMGFYAPRTLISDAQRHGIEFLELDVQSSTWDFKLQKRVENFSYKYQYPSASALSWEEVLPESPLKNPSNSVINLRSIYLDDAQVKGPLNHSKTSLDKPKFSTTNPHFSSDSVSETAVEKARNLFVRAGFRSVSGLSKEPVDKLVHEREQNGPFKDLGDFVRRSKLSRSVLLKLAAAGALRSFGIEIRDLLWILQGLSLDPHQFFFGSTAREEPLPGLPEESEWQELTRAYKTKGYSLHSHPLLILRPTLLGRPSEQPGQRAGQLTDQRTGQRNGQRTDRRKGQEFVSAAGLVGKKHRDRVRIAGLLAMMQKPPTAKGMCFLSLEDETGLFNAVLTPDVYEKCRLIILGHPLLDIEGRLEFRSGVRNIRVETIRPLAPPRPPTARSTPGEETSPDLPRSAEMRQLYGYSN